MLEDLKEEDNYISDIWKWRCPPKRLKPDPIIYEFYTYAKTSDENKELFRKHFIDGMTYKKMVEEYGTSYNNLRQRACSVYWKTRRLLLDENVIVKGEQGEYIDEEQAALLKQKLG